MIGATAREVYHEPSPSSSPSTPTASWAQCWQSKWSSRGQLRHLHNTTTLVRRWLHIPTISAASSEQLPGWRCLHSAGCYLLDHCLTSVQRVVLNHSGWWWDVRHDTLTSSGSCGLGLGEDPDTSWRSRTRRYWWGAQGAYAWTLSWRSRSWSHSWIRSWSHSWIHSRCNSRVHSRSKSWLHPGPWIHSRIYSPSGTATATQAYVATS